MDKFTKGILTVIAVGIIGINVQMLNGGSGFITKANAFGNKLTKVQICDISACSSLTYDGHLKVKVEK
ncbi:hypothetical protein OAB74_00235 [Candidatus Pelagibacter sp.]|nr:hypothetical protein [Candidatus Pelagibacter sp.]